MSAIAGAHEPATWVLQSSCVGAPVASTAAQLPPKSLDAEAVAAYLPYMAARHGGGLDVLCWRAYW